MTLSEIKENLRKVNYIANDQIACAVSGTINRHHPLLIEGDPGTGKTFLAKAVAQMLGAELIRVQIYEGMTYDKILYDYDYQRQLLSINAMRATLEREMKDKSIEEALDYTSSINFYGKRFLIERPVLRSLTCRKPCVLLIDEIDKASEELEYTLLEVLDEFRMTIPQYGTVECIGEPPMVFLTSNSYRELSDALKRRCNYLYLTRKTEEEIKNILILQADINETLAQAVASCIAKIQNLQELRQTPSIAEAITWAKFLQEDTEETHIKDTVYMLAKNKDDAILLQKSSILTGM